MKMDIIKMNENYEKIIKFCSIYRASLTRMSAIVCEKFDLCSYEDYMKFFNGVDFEVFVGNQLSMLLNEESIKILDKVLNGEELFEVFVRVWGDDVFNEFIKRSMES